MDRVHIIIGKNITKRWHMINDKHTLDQYDEISNYCRGLTYDILNLNPDNPTFVFNYNL